MKLDQLRIFVEVARRQHVTQAAEALCMTQSAVSAAVSSLESRYAVKLFHRIGRRIELTQIGEVFLDEAMAVIRRAEQAEQRIADLNGSEAGSLKLYASQTVASYWLPPRLVIYGELYPKVELELHLGNKTTVAESVLNGMADLGVVEGAVGLDGLLGEKVAEDRLVLVVGAKHAWADGAPCHRPILPGPTGFCESRARVPGRRSKRN